METKGLPMHVEYMSPGVWKIIDSATKMCTGMFAVPLGSYMSEIRIAAQQALIGTYAEGRRVIITKEC